MALRINIEDYVGKTFTYLKVIKESDPHITKGGHIHRTVLCRCKCGKEKSFQFSSVKSGLIKSCGCYSSEISSKRMMNKNKTHGKSKTPEYMAWISLKKRCLNTNHKSYNLYGGRGIDVCDRWINSFENFLEDMGNKPSKNHSIDRIDNNKGYNKDNCRWATKKEQSRNQNSNVLITYNGETKCVSEWVEILGISRYKVEKKNDIKS